MDSAYPAFKQVYKLGYVLSCYTGGRHELAIPEQNIKVKTNFIDTHCNVWDKSHMQINNIKKGV